jgi:hypothetical protein
MMMMMMAHLSSASYMLNTAVSGLSIPLAYLFIFIPVLLCLSQLVICFEISNCESSNCVLLFQDCFGYLKFHMNLRQIFLVLQKLLLRF